MWYKKYLNDKNLLVLSIYLLFVFIATQIDNSNKKLVYLVVLFSLIIFYINIYLGLSFLLLWYFKSLFNKNNKSKESFTNKIPNINSKSDNNLNLDDKLVFVFKSILQDNYNNYIAKQINNKTINDLVYTDKLDNICVNEYKKKLRSFKSLYPIYLINYQKILDLINNKNINTIKDLEGNIDLLNDKELLGFNYYRGIISFTDEHYKILNNLYFDNDIFQDRLLENFIKTNLKDEDINNSLNISNKNIETHEKLKLLLENTTNIKKNIYEILVLFDYHKLLQKSEFTPIYVNKTIKNIINSQIDEDLFKITNIKERASYFYTNYIKNTINNNIGEIKDDHILKISNQKTDDLTLLNNEFKELKLVNELANKKDTKEELTVNNLLSEFSDTLLDILKDLTDVFNKDNDNLDKKYGYEEEEDSEDNDVSDSYINNFLKKYLYFSKEIIFILTKNNRLLHTGILFLIISILIYFIDITK